MAPTALRPRDAANPGRDLPQDLHGDGLAGTGRDRLDKWLWHARFFKTRTLAAKLCRERRVRINGHLTAKPSASVSPGDVLTFPQGARVRVVRILELPARRLPSAAAASLYEDLITPSAPA